jgi:glutathione peroxidase-family protein
MPHKAGAAVAGSYMYPFACSGLGAPRAVPASLGRKGQTGHWRASIQRGMRVQHALDIDGNDVAFSQFAGKVLLILNVASACGYTEQNYVGLQALHEKYGKYGLEIIAFPSNQFGGQEPGSEEHIKDDIGKRYGVTFRMMSKVDVNGENAHPIFRCAPTQWLQLMLVHTTGITDHAYWV